MPVLIALVTLAAFALGRLWARDCDHSETGNRLDPLFDRLFRRTRCRRALIDDRPSMIEFRCIVRGVTA